MYEAIVPYIDGSRRILLISHVAPDGDAIGSLLGMAFLLRDLGKTVIAASQDGVPRTLRFLPGSNAVATQTDDARADLVISLDCSDLQRLGQVYQPSLHGALPLVNIDHHVTNLRFGLLNLVDSRATSTSEMVFDMAMALGWPIGPEAAQCLLTGVTTDTRGFRTANVTAHVLGVAQALMEAGGSLQAVTHNVLDHQTADSICLWGKALSQFQLQDRIIWTAIPLAMRGQCDDVEQSDTGLVSFLVSAEEADIAVVFSEREAGKVDVGMRSVPGVDVSQVALSLGGGGHPQAAGCTLYLPLDEAQERVLRALQNVKRRA